MTYVDEYLNEWPDALAEGECTVCHRPRTECAGVSAPTLTKVEEN